jgi:hypothetical protein
MQERNRWMRSRLDQPAWSQVKGIKLYRFQKLSANTIHPDQQNG